MARTKQKKIIEFFGSNNQAFLQSIDSQTKQLHLHSGEFSKNEPWILNDEKNEKYIVLPQKVLRNMISLIRRAHEDRLRVELERDLISLTPVDFDDAMSVAMSKIESLRQEDGSLPSIDSMKIAQEIKKEHPNLFMNFEAYSGGLS
ncbi:DUF2603 domain-containing protein [Helicobacter mustelae]|uniref:UPF0763 protein HMU09960 n=1 Tax=Helicobacter mustelae (strain ATCC 43772 / CCUG 25715 / CIP 103759 / LMG 18044 / NCTC 12198 / R85-136P) TaxID=679897 RepID=D3UID0_HELM1|nr:DUF2603 domain-containing protein [Helicobacter mustelae]CBG40253.1 putative hypothetical protein [Helicobacter mustelae 12198]SQH71752.1 Protein of uncharacterised function (DUF2603) [Helicobacter mustelae]STP12881.1 Protein of uncharacterised function (DUF2603) [Helicobacter mustelae]